MAPVTSTLLKNEHDDVMSRRAIVEKTTEDGNTVDVSVSSSYTKHARLLLSSKYRTERDSLNIAQTLKLPAQSSMFGEIRKRI
jgi:hypothetical protein